MMTRVRFAPSPTGELHIGNVRAALFNWLFARHERGEFILRIEDTDVDRNDLNAISKIYSSLRWLGLEWDEGPVSFESDEKPGPGDYGPYLQSGRGEIYREHIEALEASGMTYPCYCTEDEILAERERAIKKKRAYRYSGRCLKLSAAEKTRFEEEGRKPALRFRVKDEKVEFDDIVRGRVSISTREFGDFIIQRNDGTATYNFAAVVDDHLMRISHVIRGEEHLSNTPKQILLYRALGWSAPLFCHLPLITGEDNRPLSKRESHVSIDYFREKGFLASAMVNYLSLLGWSSPDGRDVMAPEELIERFTLERVHKSPAKFDMKRLLWLNGKIMRGLSSEDLLREIKPWLVDAGVDVAGTDGEWLFSALESVRDNLNLATDAAQALEPLLEKDISFQEDALKIISEQQAQEVLKAFISELESRDGLDKAVFSEIMSSVGKLLGLKGHALYMPVRAGLTGRTAGPELVSLADIFSREEWIRRMKSALDKTK